MFVVWLVMTPSYLGVGASDKPRAVHIDFLADAEMTGAPELRPEQLPPAIAPFVADTAARRGLLRQPEVVLGAWRAARASAPDMTEDEARLALERLDPLWEENSSPRSRRASSTSWSTGWTSGPAVLTCA